MKYFVILQDTRGMVIVTEFNKEVEANAHLATLCPPYEILLVSYGYKVHFSTVLAWEYDNGACSFQIKKKGAA